MGSGAAPPAPSPLSAAAAALELPTPTPSSFVTIRELAARSHSHDLASATTPAPPPPEASSTLLCVECRRGASSTVVYSRLSLADALVRIADASAAQLAPQLAAPHLLPLSLRDLRWLQAQFGDQDPPAMLVRRGCLLLRAPGLVSCVVAAEAVFIVLRGGMDAPLAHNVAALLEATEAAAAAASVLAGAAAAAAATSPSGVLLTTSRVRDDDSAARNDGGDGGVFAVAALRFLLAAVQSALEQRFADVMARKPSAALDASSGGTRAVWQFHDWLARATALSADLLKVAEAAGALLDADSALPELGAQWEGDAAAGGSADVAGQLLVALDGFKAGVVTLRTAAALATDDGSAIESTLSHAADAKQIRLTLLQVGVITLNAVVTAMTLVPTAYGANLDSGSNSDPTLFAKIVWANSALGVLVGAALLFRLYQRA